MSGIFPTSPAASSVNIKSIEPTLVSVTQNLKRQVNRKNFKKGKYKSPLHTDLKSPNYNNVGD